MRPCFQSLIAFICYSFQFSAFSQEIVEEAQPDIIQENIVVYRAFESQYVSQRDVYVRLPADYDSNPAKHRVLYMHDGQMLFEKVETWNGHTWAVDKVLRRLVQEGTIGDLIVVGIANVAAERHPNYWPEKPFKELPENKQDSIMTLSHGVKLFNIRVNSDDYLKFLVEELKPFIDSKYNTKTDASNTFVAGSSMGGLISMYAFFEYPDVFGGAAGLSTHWIGVFTDNHMIPDSFRNYISDRKGLIRGRKLYLDAGTEGLDQYYGPYLKAVDGLFVNDPDLSGQYRSQVYQGKAHSETDWHERFHIPLEFLLTKN